MFAKFDEIPAMLLQDIRKKKTLQMHGHTDKVKTVYPPHTKFAGQGSRYRSPLSPNAKK